jgi:hypothetical protein
MAKRMTEMKEAKSQQSARFIEAAKKTGADESGKKFEKAFKKIVPPSRSKNPK